MTYSILYQLHSVFLGKKKKKHLGTRHKWDVEQEEELNEIFKSIITTTKKLPKLKEIEALVKKCPTVYKHLKERRMTVSAIKNKIDRIFRITIK